MDATHRAYAGHAVIQGSSRRVEGRDSKPWQWRRPADIARRQGAHRCSPQTGTTGEYGRGTGRSLPLGDTLYVQRSYRFGTMNLLRIASIPAHRHTCAWLTTL